MKHSKILLIFAAAILMISGQAFAGLLYPYNRLALKDLDQMNKLIKDKIQESRKSQGDRIIPLKEALQAVYSRPNEDFLIEKIVNSLKTELDERDGYELSMKALVKEALGALKNPKAFNAVAQTTYAIFLENVIAEMKPKASSSGFERGLLEQIQTAKVKLSKEAVSERRLKMMKGSVSPSDIASEALKVIEEEEAAAKKKKEEDQKSKSEQKSNDTGEGPST